MRSPVWDPCGHCDDGVSPGQFSVRVHRGSQEPVRSMFPTAKGCRCMIPAWTPNTATSWSHFRPVSTPKWRAAAGCCEKDGGLIQNEKSFLFPFYVSFCSCWSALGLMLYPLISNWYGERVRSTVGGAVQRGHSEAGGWKASGKRSGPHRNTTNLYTACSFDPAAAVDDMTACWISPGNGIMGMWRFLWLMWICRSIIRVAESLLTERRRSYAGTSSPIGGKKHAAVISAFGDVRRADVYRLRQGAKEIWSCFMCWAIRSPMQSTRSPSPILPTSKP